MRRALTPQCFRYEILRRAFAENEIGEIVTDECFLVEKLGVEVSIVEGSAKNIKITTPEDFLLGGKFVERNHESKCLESVSETIFTDSSKIAR